MGGPADEVAAGRAQLAQVSRELAAEGLVTGTSGNLSCRTAGGILITPTGARLDRLQADQIPLVDGAGAVIDGELEPSSELGLHLAVYARRGAGAVVHTHAPMATAVGCVVDELPCVHYVMLDLGGPVPVVPYMTFGTPELAAAVVAALDGHAAALLSNHGTVTCGADLAQAAERSRLLEWAATLYWHAAAIGTPRALTGDQLGEVVAEMDRRAYGSTHRLAEPGGAAS